MHLKLDSLVIILLFVKFIACVPLTHNLKRRDLFQDAKNAALLGAGEAYSTFQKGIGYEDTGSKKLNVFGTEVGGSHGFNLGFGDAIKKKPGASDDDDSDERRRKRSNDDNEYDGDVTIEIVKEVNVYEIGDSDEHHRRYDSDEHHRRYKRDPCRASRRNNGGSDGQNNEGQQGQMRRKRQAFSMESAWDNIKKFIMDNWNKFLSWIREQMGISGGAFAEVHGPNGEKRVQISTQDLENFEGL